MQVHWYDPRGDLIASRPQTAIPQRGEDVPVTEADGSTSTYRVGRIAWLLSRRVEGREWFSLTDEAKVEVCVYLIEEESL